MRRWPATRRLRPSRAEADAYRSRGVTGQGSGSGHHAACSKVGRCVSCSRRRAGPRGDRWKRVLLEARAEFAYEADVDRTVMRTLDRVAHAENVRARSRKGELIRGEGTDARVGCPCWGELSEGARPVLWKPNCEIQAGPPSGTWDRNIRLGATSGEPVRRRARVPTKGCA